MARILWLSPYLPWPPDHGGRIRSLALFGGLLEGHDVHLVAGRAPEDPEDAEDQLALRGFSVTTRPLAPLQGRLPLRARVGKLGRLATGRSFLLPRFRDTDLARAVREAARNADLAVLDHAWMGAYMPEIEGLPVVYSSHNVESAFLRTRARTEGGVLGWMTRLEARALARFERALALRSRATVVVSEEDRTRFRELASEAPDPIVVSNGVDLATRPWLPLPAAEAPQLLYLGGHDYAPNADAARRLAREVLPLVRREIPDAQALLVGRDPKGALADLADRPEVILRGHVPDVLDAWREASVLVAPLHFGGGSRLKILEAFAVGRPVVTTRLGAEGLPVTHGQELWLGETPEELAAATRQALARTPETGAVIERARALVKASYDWPALAASFRAAVEKALARMPA